MIEDLNKYIKETPLNELIDEWVLIVNNGKKPKHITRCGELDWKDLNIKVADDDYINEIRIEAYKYEL